MKLPSFAAAPPVVIDTLRLRLREVNLSDAPFILELLNEPAFLSAIGDKGVRDLDSACDYIVQGPMASYVRHGFGLYVVTLREATTRVGICGLVKREALPDVDLGFAFLEAFRLRGYATEAARAVMSFAVETLKLQRVVAITAADNCNSIAVLEKVGLRYERMISLSATGEKLRLFVPIH